jgi:hypothetical protein
VRQLRAAIARLERGGALDTIEREIAPSGLAEEQLSALCSTPARSRPARQPTFHGSPSGLQSETRSSPLIGIYRY